MKQKALSELSSPIFSTWLSPAPIIFSSILRSLLSIDSENASNFLSNAEVISSFDICAGVPTTVSPILNAFSSSEIASVASVPFSSVACHSVAFLVQ